jgi:hypothetical protein
VPLFAGHYAPAIALHRRFPEVPLWQLFLAVQGVDVLFWGLAATGVERMRVDANAAGNLGLILEYMPWSHSLVAAVGWAAVTALATRSRAGLVLAAGVASHWFCDLPVHLGDLPLAAGEGVRVGLGLWAHPVAAWALEVGLVTVAALGAERRVAALAALLIVVQTLQTFVVPLPSGVGALAATCEASYAGFAVLAWLARRR